MWSKKHNCCQTCNATLFKHIGKGLCERCYRVSRKKIMLELELNKLSDEQIITLKRPLLHHECWEITNRELLIENILEQEENKLYNLKFYGKLETNEINIDLLKFEYIFNKVANRIKKEKNVYTQKLNSLFNSLDDNQRRQVLMQLLKLVI